MISQKNVLTLPVVALVCGAWIVVITGKRSVNASRSLATVYSAKVAVIALAGVNATGVAAKAGEAKGKTVINRAGKLVIAVSIGGALRMRFIKK